MFVGNLASQRRQFWIFWSISLQRFYQGFRRAKEIKFDRFVIYCLPIQTANLPWVPAYSLANIMKSSSGNFQWFRIKKFLSLNKQEDWLSWESRTFCRLLPNQSNFQCCPQSSAVQWRIWPKYLTKSINDISTRAFILRERCRHNSWSPLQCVLQWKWFVGTSLAWKYLIKP